MSVVLTGPEARRFQIRIVADKPELAGGFINRVTVGQFRTDSLFAKGYGAGGTDFLVENTYTDLFFQAHPPEDVVKGGLPTWQLFQGGVLLLDLSRVVARIDLAGIVPGLGIPQDCPMLLAGILPENPENREVTAEEAESLARRFNLPYFEIDLRQEQQASQAVAQLVSTMIRRRFPAWTPGQQLPPAETTPEVIEARKRRQALLIRLLSGIVTLETHSLGNLTRELEKTKLLPLRQMLTDDLIDGRSHVTRVKMIIESLTKGGWLPPLQRNARLSVTTEYRDHLQRSTSLLKDAILASIDEDVKHHLNVMLRNNEAGERELVRLSLLHG